jgi:2-(1,2-epoxy-1,2-dihydrophenyl)acetyl-CoA isomerase
MTYTTLLFDVRDGVAHITLNRPDAANSVNLELAKDLLDAALRCEEDPAVRAVVLSGTGKMFCSGGDLKSFGAQGSQLPRYLKDVTTHLHAAVSHFTRSDAPVIAAINGSAAGAGMSLACACDIVLAAESARFTMAYTRAGLSPDGASTYFLSRIVGLRRALELTLTNRVLTAAEALALGIVTRVVPDAALAAEADALATQFATGATRALGAAKRLLHRGWTETLESQMEQESRSIAEVARSADAREGIAAFGAKRAPVFKGE